MPTTEECLTGLNNIVKEKRPSQLEMGLVVEEVIKNNKIAFIEAPVGSGKSFAYLIPSILSDKRVIITTAKKELQHQLVNKDIPYLLGKMGVAKKVALLKGKSNYGCPVKAKDALDISSWLASSLTGDWSTYPREKPKDWFEFSAEDCIGRHCPNKDSCGYWREKKKLDDADIIVTNHHLVGFDLKFGPFKILKEYDCLIVDEAHQFISSVRGAYSSVVKPKTINYIIKQIDKAGVVANTEYLRNLWLEAFDLLSGIEGDVVDDPFGVIGVRLISEFKDILSQIKSDLKQEGVTVDSESDELIGSPHTDWNVVSKLEMLRQSVNRVIDTIIATQETHDNIVVYTTSDNKNNKLEKTLNRAPVALGPLIGSKLKSIGSMIFTSATLAVNNSFGVLKNQLGITISPAIEKVLPSPFDYKRQALLYIPKDIPLPSDEDYLDAISNRIENLVIESKGNAFVLFSSSEELKQVDLKLRRCISLPIFAQTDGAEGLLESFKNTPNAILLGLKSFWEGVDIVGDKLRLVIITKLPFPVPSEPIHQARVRAYIKDQVSRGLPEYTAEQNAFTNISVPSMIIDIRQGAGRLIRSKSDRGVLAILDPRCWTGSSKRLPTPEQKLSCGYGAATLNAIGFTQRTADIGLVKRYLAKISEHAP